MTVRSLLDELSRRLRDTERRQWSEPVLTEAVNAALAALCNTVPAAHTVERTIPMNLGSSQQLPSDLHRLVRVLYNTDATGSVGRPVTRVDQAIMDMAAPGWRNDAPRGHIRHWMQSDIEERRFDVWPQAADAPLDVSLRVIATSVPCIETGEAPVCGPEIVVPAEPVAPVEIPAIGSVPSHGYFDTSRLFGEGTSSDWVELTLPDDSPLLNASGIYDLVPHNGAGDIVVVWPDTSGMIGTRNARIRRQVYGVSTTHVGGNDLGSLQSAPFVFVKWEDMIPGETYRMDLSNNSFTLIGADPYRPPVPVTQQQLTDYAVAVATYFPLLYAKWLRDAGCDGTLPATPVLSATDPGPLGAGSDLAADGYVSSVAAHSSPSSGYNGFFVAGTPPINGDAFFDAALEAQGFELDIEWPGSGLHPSPGTAANLNRYFLFEGSTQALGYSGFTFQDWRTGVMVGSTLAYNSALLDAPSTLRVRKAAGSTWEILAVNARSEGTSQAEIDAFAEAQARYTASLAAYNAAVAAVPTVAAGALTLDSELPVDKFYRQPLQEFALYYLWSRDDELTANSARAARHLNQFYQLLNKTEDTAAIVVDNSMRDER